MHAWPRPYVPALPASGPERLSLYDSAAEAVRPVGPTAGEARIYVCGITPYDATHLGHAFTYLTFDLVIRAWLDLGLDVDYAQNVTDVDDPLLERAAATGADWEELAKEQTDLFRADMTALRVIPPDHYVGVVESVQEIAATVARLRDLGVAYQVTEGYADWYADRSRVTAFGDVSHFDHDEMLATFAERGGDPDRPGKRDPLDWLLWRQEREGDPAWDSEVGRGRPGWHIECTTIATQSLDGQVHVQGGGSDLVFPHHEMCAAEGQALTDHDFADAYVHVGMVGLDGEKMSKSRGNLVFVSKLRAAGVDPMAIRTALLGHHYRTDWEWTDADLARAHERLDLWRKAVQGRTAVPAADLVTEVREALRDDLHAERALAAVDAWAIASLTAATDDPDARVTVSTLVDALLGVRL